MPKVLVIDDDDSFREVMVYHLTEEGIEADAAVNGDAGLAAFDPSVHAVVVTDLKMPGIDGMVVLERIKEKSPSTVVLVITAFGTIEKAVEAMKGGAFDFIPKPCTRDHFKLSVKRALEHHKLHVRVRELELALDAGDRRLVYRSEAMTGVVELVDRVAPSEATVLITGESGVGKELIARRLHRKSRRGEGPFVAVNCAAIPAELMESELFGHAKGAFTGAARDHKGKFEQANGGTLFLDEIAELPENLQTKLLRVLSERVIDVVGKEKPAPVDVRIIAATNRDLGLRIEEGKFREDLYFRINVVQVEVPPLRYRKQDIPPLVDHFLRRFSEGRTLHLTDEAKARIAEHNWAGNVRELENYCRRLSLLAEDDQVDADALPPFDSRTKGGGTEAMDATQIRLPDGGISLVDLEKTVIEQALALNHYNQAKTARFLRVPRHILLYRIEKYRIEIPSKN